MFINFINFADFNKKLSKNKDNSGKDWIEVRIFSQPDLESILISRIITIIFHTNFISFEI